MCGILAVLGAYDQQQLAQLLKQLEARGPEYSTLQTYSSRAALGFTRLAINGLTSDGNQPFSNMTNLIHSVCNGEIYNYQELARRWNISLVDGTSDCAVLPALASQLSPSALCNTLDGVFAFVVINESSNTLLVARDPFGVRPLFEATTASGTRMWASEIKALPTESHIIPFPPGTWAQYDLTSGELLETHRYHTVSFAKLPLFSFPHSRDYAKKALRTAVVAAVKKRLISDRPIGALLSGGLDSSLIAAIAARELARTGKQLTTFSIGMPGSTDLIHARAVAKHIHSQHHEIVLKTDDFLTAIPHVVRDIESYDITSVRASVGNWLIGKYIKENTDIKVVFNGDGSDEIGGGYLYFYAAPSNEEFEAECERLLQEIHLFDVLRSDRSMAAHGLEARTPYLDKAVVATWCALPTEYRRPAKADLSGRGAQMEKMILREAFENDKLLPWEVLWRKKEAFSDGVSSTEDSWYKQCMTYAKSQGVSLADVVEKTHGWHNPPITQEAYWYRMLFEKTYGSAAATVIPHYWMPRWIVGAQDPSARTLNDLY